MLLRKFVSHMLWNIYCTYNNKHGASKKFWPLMQLQNSKIILNIRKSRRLYSTVQKKKWQNRKKKKEEEERKAKIAKKKHQNRNDVTENLLGNDEFLDDEPSQNLKVSKIHTLNGSYTLTKGLIANQGIYIKR